jgi:hypothetical protein
MFEEKPGGVLAASWLSAKWNHIKETLMLVIAIYELSGWSGAALRGGLVAKTPI